MPKQKLCLIPGVLVDDRLAEFLVSVLLISSRESLSLVDSARHRLVVVVVVVLLSVF